MTDLLGTSPPKTIAKALADPYFRSLSNVDREPSTHPISKFVFEFERRKLAKEDVRELIYRETTQIQQALIIILCNLALSWLQHLLLLFQRVEALHKPEMAY